ncbi:MAG TPA: NADP-dependent oxidoreductase [Candidatus Didemnitutus sp.]
MKAVRIHSYGGSDVLQVDDIATPQPGLGEVLVKVRAASVNPVDYKIRSGQHKSGNQQPPLTLGRDISGVVSAVGPGVTDFKVGEEVYAMLDWNSGGNAEYAIAKREGVARKPASIDHLHAAAVPLAATTAWQGLFDQGNLQAGERVLIHGAAGGVGHFAVQFAKNRGAYVIAMAREEDRDFLKRLGADEVIDYQKERFEDRVRDIDLVLDLVAGETQKRSWKVLKPGGRLVSALGAPREEDALKRKAVARGFMAAPNREELSRIGRMIDDKKVMVAVEKTLPLSAIRAAHDHLEHDHIRGKVVLTVG